MFTKDHRQITNPSHTHLPLAMLKGFRNNAMVAGDHSDFTSAAHVNAMNTLSDYNRRITSGIAAGSNHQWGGVPVSNGFLGR